jgi:hypothetical protein
LRGGGGERGSLGFRVYGKGEVFLGRRQEEDGKTQRYCKLEKDLWAHKTIEREMHISQSTKKSFASLAATCKLGGTNSYYPRPTYYTTCWGRKNKTKNLNIIK